jgi:hypothetical protein
MLVYYLLIKTKMSKNLLNTPEVKVMPPWGGVTDPLMHDSSSFRYLLHLDSGQPVDGDGEDPNSEWEYLMSEPARLKSLGYISTSLVDESHPVLWQGTASSHGFIVETSASGVIAASSRDMYTKGKSLDSLRAQYPPPDPDTLLMDTPANSWNEVLISAEDAAIRAVFWVDAQPGDDPTYTRAEVQAMADEAGLPLIELDLVKY